MEGRFFGEPGCVFMILELAHTTLMVRDLDIAVQHYRQILDREPDSRTDSEGLEYVVFTLGNAAFRIATRRARDPEAKRAPRNSTSMAKDCSILPSA